MFSTRIRADSNLPCWCDEMQVSDSGTKTREGWKGRDVEELVERGYLEEACHGSTLLLCYGLILLLHHTQARYGELKMDFDFGLCLRQLTASVMEKVSMHLQQEPMREP